MAFHRTIKRRSKLPFAAKRLIEVKHHHVIAAAVPEGIFHRFLQQLSNREKARTMSVARKTDIVVFFVHFYFAERAVEGHFSPRQGGEGGHRQIGFDTIFKLHDHRLVIYNVVVASENASAFTQPLGTL